MTPLLTLLPNMKNEIESKSQFHSKFKNKTGEKMKKKKKKIVEQILNFSEHPLLFQLTDV